jgi:hypothetical protein
MGVSLYNQEGCIFKAPSVYKSYKIRHIITGTPAYVNVKKLLFVFVFN